RAREFGKRLLQRGDFRAVDELAVSEHAADRLVDRLAEPAPLRADIDEGDRFGGHVLVHDAFKYSRIEDQPTTRRGPLRSAEAAGREGCSRQRIAISRLATPSSPVTAGALPVRTALRKAISSARSGSSWPTGRCRIE